MQTHPMRLQRSKRPFRLAKDRRRRRLTVPETVGIEYETLIDLAHDKSKQGRAA